MCARCGGVIRDGEEIQSYPREIPGGLLIPQRQHVSCPDGIWD